MKRARITAIAIAILFFLTVWRVSSRAQNKTPTRATWWSFQSIDTMKYSRDPSREKLRDPSFDAVIDQQVKEIADTGATHVAIATPYDDEFIPMLKRWVAAARKNNLSVWFRGNWSGWERWFGYAGISREEHITKTRDFILKHSDLFMDGDIFSACPECENGGPGNPQITGDVNGYRKFLITEYKVTQQAFAQINKNVGSNYFSMNGDVAKLIMDKPTTKALGGIVTIDHYVKTPEKLITDIRSLANQSGGRIVLGEFGAPIPDIHGNMTESQQAAWIGSALQELAMEPSVIGVNYWVNIGGSTELWSTPAKPKTAVATLTSYFRPKTLQGIVVTVFNKPIHNAEVISSYQKTTTNKDGLFSLPVINADKTIRARAGGYVDSELIIDPNSSNIKIVMKKIQKNILLVILDYLKSLFTISL